MAAKVRLLQEADDRRRQFQAMLRENESEAARDGTFTVESALAEADRIIDELMVSPPVDRRRFSNARI